MTCDVAFDKGETYCKGVESKQYDQKQASAMNPKSLEQH
jgi:hypothetical protein